MRQIKFLVLTALLLSACNLASNVTTTPDIVSTQPVENSNQGVPIAASPLPTSTSNSTGCLPRTEWPVYAVVAGDNLSDIASRAGNTVDELVAANCLGDPDALNVGQELHVPRLPANTSSSSGNLTYASTYGFAFDYPSGWYIQNIPGSPVTGISLSSFPYDLNSEPPEAGWTSDMVIITFAYVPSALASNNLATWFAQEKSQLSEIGDVNEESFTLLSGLPAMRLGFVSASGHFINMVFTIINGNNILVSARGNSNLYNPIINSLRSV